MKNISNRILVVLLLLAISAAGALAQGLYWESTVSGDKIEGTDVVKTWYMPKMMKIQTGKEGDFSILRLDQEKFYMIKSGEKTYSVMTFAEMEQGMKRANAQMEKAMEQMKDMPAEQREMMEKLLGKSTGKKEAKAVVKKLGDTKKVGGFACTRHKIMRGTEEIAELWITKEIRGFDAMRNDLKAFSKRMTTMNPMMGGDLASAMESLDGFPMETGMMGMKTVVTKVEPKSTTLSEFEVPSGYKKVDMKHMGESQE